MSAAERPFAPVAVSAEAAVVVATHRRKRPGPVGLADRQGVFVHSFQCGECDLEFALFSWRAFRHRADTVACPECQTVTSKTHWVRQLSAETAFDPTGETPEIWTFSPLFGGVLVDDSAPPPDHRYEETAE